MNNQPKQPPPQNTTDSPEDPKPKEARPFSPEEMDGYLRAMLEPRKQEIRDRLDAPLSTTEKGSSENEKPREVLSRPTFKKKLSDEEFQALSNRITEAMIQSIRESKPD